MITDYLALNEAGLIIAAARLSIIDRANLRDSLRPENITPKELHAALTTGNLKVLWRTEWELNAALHYAQAHQIVAQENRKKIADISPEMLNFLDECRALGLGPQLKKCLKKQTSEE